MKRRAHADGPQADKIPGSSPGTTLPVVIGSGSHPFPFRTRKLSLIPPMVLRGKLCGRVGRCRHYFEARELKQFAGFLSYVVSGFSRNHTVSRALRGLSSLAASLRAAACMGE